MRKKLSGQYPGYSAFYFSQVFEIISKAVIGWDFKSSEPTEVPGLFGIPTALFQTIEEQGCTRLHLHSIIWVSQMREKLDELFKSFVDIERGDRGKTQKIMKAEKVMAHKLD